jgi:Cyclic nucleotide-binding domain
LRFAAANVGSGQILRLVFALDIFAYLASPASFVHLATLCYVLGLLTRNELILRTFLLSGSLLYILYYYNVGDRPLWEAIVASGLIALSNVPVIFRIFKERSTLGMSEEMLTLYRSFPNFNPGQFRKLMRKAQFVTVEQSTTLLQQGEQPTHLYLTTSYGFGLIRDDRKTELGPDNLLGEISCLLGGPATATVIAEPGCSYVAWEVSDLRDLMQKSQTIENAVTVLLSQDIARKLAVSFPQKSARPPLIVDLPRAATPPL